MIMAAMLAIAPTALSVPGSLLILVDPFVPTQVVVVLKGGYSDRL
ncbi:MAG TPA: hypothetical protein VLH85_00815 [Levilinea sp.]|nr:hypothetical protein [Levilinea sp.]